MATNIELQPILVDSDTKNIENRLITPSTQTFYAHKATETDYGVVTLGQINKAVSDHNEDENAHSNIIGPIKTDLDEHIANKNNPHEVTKEQIGLGNVPNVDVTKELDKKVDKVVESGDAAGNIGAETGENSLTIFMNVTEGSKNSYVKIKNDATVEISAYDTEKTAINPLLAAMSGIGVSPNKLSLISTSNIEMTANSATLNDKKILVEGDVNLDGKVDKSKVTTEGSDTYTSTIDNDKEIRLTASKNSSSETLMSVSSDGFQVVTTDGEKTKLLVVTPEEISIGDSPTGDLKPVATETYVDNKILDITSVRIRNVNEAPIEATSDSVQTVATTYIVTNYNRQPEAYDGLFITLTDKDNDVVEYAYFNDTWVNIGLNGVDLSAYATKTDLDTKLNKLTTIGTFDRAYIAKKDGTQGTLNIDSDTSANSLVQRDDNGRIRIRDNSQETPYTDSEAVNKKYLDEQLSNVTAGLTVLQASDFPLNAELLEKVKANPQNYCIKISFYIYNYSDEAFQNGITYKCFNIEHSEHGWGHPYCTILKTTGALQITASYNHTVIYLDPNTIKYLNNYSKVVGILSESNNQTLSGDDIYLANTIDIGDDT